MWSCYEEGELSMEAEKKYVAVDVLRNAINTETADVIADHGHYTDAGFSRDALEHIIDNIKTENVAPVVHARWIDNTFCSNCNYCEENEYGRVLLSGDKRFCAGCGAKMDLEVEF
jgi:hypothetical protein